MGGRSAGQTPISQPGIGADAQATARGKGSLSGLVLVGLGGIGLGGLLVVAVLAIIFGPQWFGEEDPQALETMAGLEDVEAEAPGEPVEAVEVAVTDRVDDRRADARPRQEEPRTEAPDVQSTVDQAEKSTPTAEPPLTEPSTDEPDVAEEQLVDAALAPIVSISSQPRVLGDLTVDDVTRPLALALERFNACYAEGLARDAGIQGAMTQIFVIGPKGKVIETNVDASTVGDAAVEICFAGIIESMVFPAPTGGEIVVVEYRFGLSSDTPG